MTLRIANDIPSLRSSRRFGLIRQCFASVLAKPGMRLVELTVLSNAIRYVFGNAERHYGSMGQDFCSSEEPDAIELLDVPQGWLLQEGWSRAPRHLLARLLRIRRYRSSVANLDWL